MASSFSEKQLNFARKKYFGKLYFTNYHLNFFMIIVNKILIILFNIKIRLINFKRYIFSCFLIIKKSNNNFVELKYKINLDQNQIEKFSGQLNSNKYVFIKNFIDPENYNHLLKNWPDLNFFNQLNKIIKYYSYGFVTIKNEMSKTDQKKLNKHNALKDYYNFIQSNTFKIFVNKLLNFKNLEFFNYSIHSNMIGNGSLLIPHIDGVKKNKLVYGFIYFVDGNDDNIQLSGATGIYNDNDFNSPIFIPNSLKNTLLIYSSTTNLFRGFQLTKMPNNVYRKAINFQFFSKRKN